MKQRPSFPARLDTTLAKPRTATQARAGTVLPPPPQGHGMDSSAVRNRMVHKLAAAGVTDAEVLAAMGTIERHRFVDSALINQAYEDTDKYINKYHKIRRVDLKEAFGN